MGVATRESYGKVLKEYANDPRIVVLDAAMGKATKSITLKDVAPDRYFDMGIAEGDMIGTAAGMATSGLIPIASNFAMCAAGSAYEQIRNSIGYPHLNVKIAATHAGVTVGEDCGSHQAIEDIALMRVIPGMTILNPADGEEAEQAIRAMIEYDGPCYIRLGRAASPDIHSEGFEFKIGKGEIIRDGKDATIVATGIMVAKAIEAAEALKEKGLDVAVINMATIKPFDRSLVRDYAVSTGVIVTAEEHSVIGGLGSAVLESVEDLANVRVKRVGVQDVFGQSGKPDELLEHYGLTASNIVEKVLELKE